MTFVQSNKTFWCLFHSKKHTIFCLLARSLVLSAYVYWPGLKMHHNKANRMIWIRIQDIRKNNNERVNCCKLRIVNVLQRNVSSTLKKTKTVRKEWERERSKSSEAKLCWCWLKHFSWLIRYCAFSMRFLICKEQESL